MTVLQFHPPKHEERLFWDGSIVLADVLALLVHAQSLLADHRDEWNALLLGLTVEFWSMDANVTPVVDKTGAFNFSYKPIDVTPEGDYLCHIYTVSDPMTVEEFISEAMSYQAYVQAHSSTVQMIRLECEVRLVNPEDINEYALETHADYLEEDT
jgi:hypothetical protein